MKTLVSHLLLLAIFLFSFHPSTLDYTFDPENLTIFHRDLRLDLPLTYLGERSSQIQLNAYFDKNKVVMDWTESRVEDTEEYSLARSEDGENWLNIAGFRVMDEEKGIKNFHLEDINLKADTYEYRLKKIKKNGEISFSNKVKVLLTLPQLIKVYPNPILDNVLIEVPGSDSNYNIEMSDAAGKNLIQKAVGGQASTQKISIKTGYLPKGIYLVSVKSEKLIHNQTVVKR